MYATDSFNNPNHHPQNAHRLLFLFHILTRVQTIRFGPRGILVAGVFEKLMGLKVHWRLHQNVFLGTRKIGGRLNYMLYICLLVAQ